MKFLSLIALVPLIFLAACGGAATQQKPAATRKTLTQRMDEENGYKKDANGNWKPQTDKRSPFENRGQDPNFAGKSFKKKAYKTGDYAKKSWWGNKQYDRKSYAGNTDASRFQKTSDLQGKGAREANTAADIPDRYQTDRYATKSAREAGAATIARPSNDLIENRQKVFKQPEVIDWRQQRSISMDQSKGILGR
jgi:hypothetical protein